MSKLSRMWDWLLPGLISLSQTGAFAYYIAGAEEEAPQYAPRREGRLSLVLDASMEAV